MDPQDAIDLSQEAIRTCIFVGGPILIASLLIGLVVSLVQSMTQLHDQSIAFVPKILLMLVAIAICLPWLADRMVEFTKYSLEKPVVFQAGSNDELEDEKDEPADSRYTFAFLSSPKSEVSELSSSKSNFPKLDLPKLTLPKPSPFKPSSFKSALPGQAELTAPKLAAPTLPTLRSNQSISQPQFRPEPTLQPRVASPFKLPAFRAADSDAPDVPAAETKTF